MKKIFILFTAAVFAAGMYAQQGYGILVNGKMYYEAPAIGDKDYQGRDQYKASVSLQQGDTWCVYDATNKVPFTIEIEAGEGSAKSSFTEGANAATCNVAGCYDFYIKLKWEDNSLWVQTGSDCSATGVEISGQGGGEDNPPVTPPSDAGYWYWKGSLDGVDINSEVDGGLFDCGVSEIEVKENGYLFVVYQVHGVPGVQYMSPSYVDGPTHATMTTTGNEKLHIPAGNWTLYLYDNGDGTVELSFEQLSGKNLVGCEGQSIENTLSTDKAHKVIIDGQLRIIRGNKVFDATGQQL